MRPNSNQPVYFECTMCGECCSSWNIPVETEKALKLLEKPWVLARLGETSRELVKVSEALYRIPLTDENFCVFLADDRRCLIEINEGLALKPYECQRFPFAAVVMPDGSTRYESSAACKAISEKLLLAFRPIVPKSPEVEDFNTATNDSGVVSQPHMQETPEKFQADPLDELQRLPKRIPLGFLLARSRSIDPEGYARYEEELGEIFENPAVHPHLSLKRIQILLKSLSGYRKQTLQPLKSPAKVFQMSARCSSLITLLFLRRPYGSWTLFNLIRGKKYHDPRVFGLAIDLQAQRVQGFPDEYYGRMNAFLFSLLQRKRLLSDGASLVSLLAMATIACLLIIWYAKALAWLRGSQNICDTDVSGAIRLVERYYTGHQPRFMAFFLSPIKGYLLQKILLG